MKTFKVGKIYAVRKGNVDTYVYPISGKDILYIEPDESFLVLKQGEKKNECVVLVLTGNNKGKTGFVWFASSAKPIVENFEII